MTSNSKNENHEQSRSDARQCFEQASAALDELRNELDRALEERKMDRVADLLDDMKSLAATLDELAKKVGD